MHRFYSPSPKISEDKIIISDKSQLHHLKRVLRLRPKDEVVVFDNNGNEYYAFVETLLPQSAILKVNKSVKSKPKPGQTQITVACAMPKGLRMDEIIDKLTQLGVDRIIPLETERVVVRLNKEKKLLRHKRWEKITQSASEQSQRSALPILEPVKNLKEFLSQVDASDLKLMPALAGQRRPLRDILEKSNAKNIVIIVGPEGDFSPSEINLAKGAGFIPVSLGNLVLRVETAAVAVASFIRFYLNYTS